MTVKPIPDTPGYMASDTGVIYGPDMSILKLYESNDGYLRAGIQWNTGQNETVGVHRLVLMAFETSNDPSKKVNHRDLNPKNNHHSNLEWVTNEENQIHQALFTKGVVRPLILAIGPDETYELISNAYSAAERFGCEPLDIWDAIRKDTPIGDWLLSYRRFDDPLPKALRKNLGGETKPRSINIRNVVNGEVAGFETIGSAARFFGVSASHIYQAISCNGKNRLLKKKYQVVYGDEIFPELSDEELDTLKNLGSKPTLAYSVDKAMYIVYPNARKFIVENGLSKKAVTKTLKDGTIRKINGWWFTYLTTDGIERLKAVAGLPDPQLA